MPGDAARRADQAAQDRLALDDPGVLGGMDRGGRLVGQAREVGPAADRLELFLALERLGHRHDVDGLAPVEQLQDRGVDPGVRLAVEVLRTQELRDLDDGIAIDEDRPEHGLLGFKTLRRKAVDHGVAGLRLVGWELHCRGGDGPFRSTKADLTAGSASTDLPCCWPVVDNPCGYPPRYRVRTD